MKKAKQLKSNTDSPKQPPTLKKGNKRGVGRKEVNQALLEKVEHRLENLHSILIHKRLEINPIRNEEHLKQLEQRYHTESKLRPEQPSTINGIFEPRGFSCPIIVPRFLLNNKPWLSRKVDLGLRITEFIKTQNPNLAARTIRDYPEIVFYDEADIYLCLVLSLNREELNKLLEESMNNLKISTALLPGNAFRKELMRWGFLIMWGNRQEQIESKKFLMEAKAETLTPYLRRGRLPSSRVSREEVVTTYKRILGGIQSLFKEGKLKYTMEQAQIILRNYIMQLTHSESFPPITGSYDDLDEEFKTRVIINKLLGEDTSEMRKVNRFGKVNKTKKERRITKIHPFNPSNIALHLTGYIYNISPDTVRSHLYR